MRFLRGAAKSSGILRLLERRLHSHNIHWLRSLFAIHDIEDMIMLDVPWWTYPAIAQVESFMAGRGDVRVFEYGSGASTVWAARRAMHVDSVEHDPYWYALVKNCLGAHPNVSLSLVEEDKAPSTDPLYVSGKSTATGKSFVNYVRAIERSEQDYDVIVIDGRARAACLKHCCAWLKADGMIVFDNSARNRYQRAIQEAGGRVCRLRGRAPALPYPEETSIITFLGPDGGGNQQGAGPSGPIPKRLPVLPCPRPKAAENAEVGRLVVNEMRGVPDFASLHP